MNRELYDFTTPPDTPANAHTTLYYFPPVEKNSVMLQPRAPAYNKPPCMAIHYDIYGKLLFTRFIFSNGTWKDDK